MGSGKLQYWSWRLLPVLLSGGGYLPACQEPRPKPAAAVTMAHPPLPPIVRRDRCEKQHPGFNLTRAIWVEGVVLKVCTECQIRLLPTLIAKTHDDDPNRPDLLFRLAELHMEMAWGYRFHSQDYEEMILAAKDKGDAQRAARLQGYRLAYAQRQWGEWREALKGFIQVASEPKYKAYERRAQALYSAASCELELDMLEAARIHYQQLGSEYPESPFTVAATLAFGEYYFDRRDFERARSQYDQVIPHQGIGLDVYALYKRAWTFYSEGRFQPALTAFLDVLTATRQGRRSRNHLVREARAELAQTYARVGTPEEALSFFQKECGDQSPAVLELLADLYFCKGNMEASRLLYRELLPAETPRFHIQH